VRGTGSPGGSDNKEKTHSEKGGGAFAHPFIGKEGNRPLGAVTPEEKNGVFLRSKKEVALKKQRKRECSYPLTASARGKKRKGEFQREATLFHAAKERKGRLPDGRPGGSKNAFASFPFEKGGRKGRSEQRKTVPFPSSKKKKSRTSGSMKREEKIRKAQEIRKKNLVSPRPSLKGEEDAP